MHSVKYGKASIVMWFAQQLKLQTPRCQHCHIDQQHVCPRDTQITTK